MAWRGGRAPPGPRSPSPAPRPVPRPPQRPPQLRRVLGVLVLHVSPRKERGGRWNMTRATMNTFTLPSSAPQAGWCSPCAAHLRPTIRRKTTKVNARLPVSSNLDTLSKELPTRNVEERQHLLEQVLRRHALRVGLCVFQQIFEVLVVDRFLDCSKTRQKTMSQVSKYFRAGRTDGRTDGHQ